jgi:hypothetical protein
LAKTSIRENKKIKLIFKLIYKKMKSIYVFLLAFLISLNCFSQSLEGDWQGSFTLTNPDATLPPLPFTTGGYVYLKLILNGDSSYTAYTSYKGGDTMNVFEVSYKRISKDSIYLQETKIIKPTHDQMSKCLQKMYLKINQRKKSIDLIGRFNFVPGGLCTIVIPEAYFGEIRFSKKTE